MAIEDLGPVNPKAGAGAIFSSGVFTVKLALGGPHSGMRHAIVLSLAAFVSAEAQTHSAVACDIPEWARVPSRLEVHVGGPGINGVVISGRTSAPIAGAIAFIEATRLWARTDSTGHFHFTGAIPAGGYELRVRAIGFAPAHAVLTIRGGTNGHVVEATLRPEGIFDWDCVIWTDTAPSLAGRLASRLRVSWPVPRPFDTLPTPRPPNEEL